MKKFLTVFMTAIVAAALFVACSSQKSIVIGSLNPVTGDAASYGVSAKNATALAVEEWNSKGGILGMPIKIVYADTKGEPTEGATAATKVIDQDHAVAILGPGISTVALAVVPIAQSKGIPLISGTASNPKVTEAGDFIFRACFIDAFQGNVMAKYLANDLKFKTAAVIYDEGSDYSKGLSEVFKTAFESTGGKVVASEGHPKTLDFKAQLTKIIATKPDAIFVPDFYNDAALIAKQARELGYKGQLAGVDGWDSPKLVEVAGSAVEGGVYPSHFSTDDTRPMVQDFIKRYTAKYGAAPDAFAALAYDAANILFTAIKTAGKTDGPAIKAALAATQYDGMAGKVSFDERRNPVKSAVILMIKDGKKTFVTNVNP